MSQYDNKDRFGGCEDDRSTYSGLIITVGCGWLVVVAAWLLLR